MEYIQIALLVILIIVSIVILIRVFLKKDNKDEDLEIKLYMQKEYAELKIELNKLMAESSKTGSQDLNVFKDHMMRHIDKSLTEINEKVEKRLGQGFDKTKETFTNVIERLTKIDEAQKKIENLSEEIVSLNVLLSDKSARGAFGEVQLYQILSAVFGDNNALYERQKKLSNNSRVDAVVYAPKPLGMIAIDSKFPLENYRKMIDVNLPKTEQEQAAKLFKTDVRKHINDIKTKYIIQNETSDQAFMFVPAEAVFAEITAYHADLIEYAVKEKVWIVSPTTLLSQLSIIQVVVNNIKRDEQAQVIIKELELLGTEFTRYKLRWDAFTKTIDKVKKEADDISITSDKIEKRFVQISNADFEEVDDWQRKILNI